MEKYTKYEIARILGARALQISMNAPLLLNISKEKLEEIQFNPLKIAELEFAEDVLPISVKRPFPKKTGKEKEEEAEEVEEVISAEEEGEKPAEKLPAPAEEKEHADLEKLATEEGGEEEAPETPSVEEGV